MMLDIHTQLQNLRREGQPIMTEKAAMIALLLQSAPLKVGPEDVFVTTLAHQNTMLEHRKLLRRTVLKEADPEQEALRQLLTDTGTANPGVDTGHISPDWDVLMNCGVPGVLEKLYRHRAQSPQRADYYDPCIQVYRALVDCFERWSEEAWLEGNEFVARNMQALAEGAPKTLAQAMQLTLVFYRLQMDLDATIVRSLGGLDHLYQPFYDAEREQEQRSLMRTFLLTLNSQHADANLPFYICDTAGNSWPMTWLILEEYRALGLYDPKLHVMYHPGLDKRLVDWVLSAIREGKSSYVFINTQVSRRALEHIGVAPEDAARLTVYGCYEVAAEGTEIPCTCGSYVNMAKAVELALGGGCDLTTGQPVGEPVEAQYSDYDEFLQAVKQQMQAIVEKTKTALRFNDRYMHAICPSLFMSPTFESSLQSGVELYAGGAKYNNTSITGVGLATLTDSLLAVKRVVFDRGLVTLQELKQILQSNWEGQERLRLICRNTGSKYGNNDPEADALALELVDLAAGLVNGAPNGRGGVFRWGQFSVNVRTTFGRKCAATPDGRKYGEPLSKNAAANVGQDKRGVTALLGSVLKLDASRIPDGCVADVVLHSSAVKGEEGLAAFRGLLETFLGAGGGSVHFNVLSPEALEAAQKDPEKYKNLQIRLCGWNVRFVSLSKQEQDEFIVQAKQENGL